MSRVAVVGAGPAGLVAARHLAESGVEVDVYEAEDAVGGRVRSREADGFTLDRGFQVLLTGYPAVQRELDLDSLDLRTVPAGAVLCRADRRSVLGDPLRDPGALPETLANPEVSVGDLYRLWRRQRELRGRSRNAIFAGSDRTILEELLDRGFSETFVEAFARPFLGGITLDRSLSTSKRVLEYVFKVLGEGRTVVPAGGMGAVTAQLAERATDASATIHASAPVSSVSAGRRRATIEVHPDARSGGDGDEPAEREATPADGGSERYDAAVVATDPPTAQELTGVHGIPTEPRGCVTQYHALPEAVAPESARLHLSAADEGPNHLVVLSNAVPELAPEDRALVSTTFLSDLDAPPAKLDDRTRRALTAWYPERHFGDLELLATDRIEFGQFAQPPGVHETLPDVGAPEGRCYLAGEYTRWSSLQGALESGRDAAQAVQADL